MISVSPCDYLLFNIILKKYLRVDSEKSIFIDFTVIMNYGKNL